DPARGEHAGEICHARTVVVDEPLVDLLYRGPSGRRERHGRVERIGNLGLVDADVRGLTRPATGRRCVTKGEVRPYAGRHDHYDDGNHDYVPGAWFHERDLRTTARGTRYPLDKVYHGGSELARTGSCPHPLYR